MTTTSLAPGGAALIFIGRSIRHTLRNSEALITAIVLPVILMLLFTFVFGGAIEPGGDYVNYVVPGIILLCAGFGSASAAVGVAQDMTKGIIDRFRTMPIRGSAVLTGHVVASLARNLMATAIVFAVALLVGFRPRAELLAWLGVIGLVALYILAITWLAAALGLVAGSVDAANGVTFGFLFLPYVSSAFVPAETMPAFLRGFAEHQPITPIIETLRGLLTGTSIGDSAWWAIGWCLLILLLSYGAGTWLFRHKTAR
ncbi:MAG: ABC transporter permease [Chloroflexota bacterium]|nr:ABC transporter permease [Chloroflexota bacterium]